MKDFNYCVGCPLLNGTIDELPECNSCVGKIVLAESLSAKAMPTAYADVDKLLPTKEQFASTLNARKFRHMQRHIYTKKHIKRAPKILAITTANFHHISSSASSDDIYAASKKCNNAYKKVAYSYKSTISLAFPKIPTGAPLGSNLNVLCHTISEWAKNKDTTVDMKNACIHAVNILQIVIAHDGLLVGLYRNDNVLHIKVGFYDKTSMAEFNRKVKVA